MQNVESYVSLDHLLNEALQKQEIATRLGKRGLNEEFLTKEIRSVSNQIWQSSEPDITNYIRLHDEISAKM